MNLTTTNTSATMSSREIAELTGKRHSHVIRDIRDMVDRLYPDSPKMDRLDFKGVFEERREDNGQTKNVHLDRYHTEVLVTGYDVKRRAAVIKRWYELESGESRPAGLRPKSQLDALQTMVDALREQEERMTALEGQVDAITKGEAFFSVVGYANMKGIRIDQQRTAAIGKMATKLCKREGIETGSAPHPLYGQVNTYPSEILSLAFDLA